MTSNSSGRVSTCCSVMSAIASLSGRSAWGCADRLELRLPGPAGALTADTNLAEIFGEFLLEEVEHLLRFGRPGGILDAGVDVLDVLPEDHHVDFFRVPDRRGNTPIPANRAQADEQIKQLPQGDVQRSDAAADRCRERPFDADKVFAERVDGFVGQPAVRLLE